MNDIKEIKQCIARLWRLYKRQECLFRSAMGLNTSFKLRKIFSNGYMMALLFRKDVDAMYQSMKSTLNDGDLSNIVRSTDEFETDSASEREVLAELSSQQQIILEAYRELISRLDDGSEAALCCDEHIEQLSGLEHSLGKELDNCGLEQSQDYSSVA
jgi:hypothetical protein